MSRAMIKSMSAALGLRAMRLYFMLALTLAPVLALAKEDEETALQEARLEGWPIGARMKDGSTALTWLMFVFLAAVGFSVLCKNAKRTHLD